MMHSRPLAYNKFYCVPVGAIPEDVYRSQFVMAIVWTEPEIQWIAQPEPEHTRAHLIMFHSLLLGALCVFIVCKLLGTLLWHCGWLIRWRRCATENKFGKRLVLVQWWCRVGILMSLFSLFEVYRVHIIMVAGVAASCHAINGISLLNKWRH